MEIFYADGNKKVGPIGKAELQSLIKAKKITAKTLVWQPGMDNWKELGVFVRSRSENVDQGTMPSASVSRSRTAKPFSEGAHTARSRS